MTNFRLMLAAIAATVSLIPAGARATETVVYSFTGAPDAAAPFGALASHGANAYGSSYQGGSTNCGAAGCGTVYEITFSIVDGELHTTEQVIYTFQGGDDGQAPLGGMTLGENGVLYGTTSQGGTGSSGTVFALYPKSGGGWTKLTLHNFTGADGSNPKTALLLGSDRALYGAAAGTVYRVVPPATAEGTPSETTVYAVGGNLSALTGDPAKALYGANLYGGTGKCLLANGDNPPIPSGCGEVFEITVSGKSWKLTPVYSLKGPPHDGQGATGVTLDSNGVLYGLSYDGGLLVGNPDAPYGGGVLYSLAHGVAGGWQETVQYRFSNPQSGWANPSQLVVTGSGDILGATSPRDVDAQSRMFQLTPGANGGSVGSLDYGPPSQGASGGLAISTLGATHYMIGAAAYDGPYGAVFIFKQ